MKHKVVIVVRWNNNILADMPACNDSAHSLKTDSPPRQLKCIFEKYLPEYRTRSENILWKKLVNLGHTFWLVAHKSIRLHFVEISML